MADYSFFTCIPRAVFDTATLTGSYQALNPGGFGDDIKILKIISDSDVGVDISYDGVNDHDFYDAEAGFLLDLQTNHADNSAYGAGTLAGRKGQVIYGKGTAGTGNIYIIGYR